MTLCLAWIRSERENQELVFATDSTLTGGEKWNHGVKLFELPRKDCLICFAGETYRAYPLILNLISTIRHNEQLQNPQLDLQEVLYGIAETFTELVTSIFELPKGDNTDIGSEAKFLFGGWSWRENCFKVWRIYYSPDVSGFLYNEEFKEGKYGNIAFLGDPETPDKSISEIARQQFKDALIKKEIFNGKLDMEPLNILVDMSRDKEIYEVDGAIQIAKIFRSGTNEFYGIMWPSELGNPTFLGRIYNEHNKPKGRYFDPDTCEIIEDQIPKSLINIQDFLGSADYSFLSSCYKEENDYFLKQDVSEKERERLIFIFRKHAYEYFLSKAQENVALQSSKTNLNVEQQ